MFSPDFWKVFALMREKFTTLNCKSVVISIWTGTVIHLPYRVIYLVYNYIISRIELHYISYIIILYLYIIILYFV